VISRDNVSVKVSAVVYFRIVDPEKAILQVIDPWEATSQLAQTTLRSVAGQHENGRDAGSARQAQRRISANPRREYGGWGMKVTNVEIKDIDLDETMIRAMAGRPKPSAADAPR